MAGDQNPQRANPAELHRLAIPKVLEFHTRAHRFRLQYLHNLLNVDLIFQTP